MTPHKIVWGDGFARSIKEPNQLGMIAQPGLVKQVLQLGSPKFLQCSFCDSQIGFELISPKLFIDLAGLGPLIPYRVNSCLLLLPDNRGELVQESLGLFIGQIKFPCRIRIRFKKSCVILGAFGGLNLVLLRSAFRRLGRIRRGISRNRRICEQGGFRCYGVATIGLGALLLGVGIGRRR